jgi:hypothetical protein
MEEFMFHKELEFCGILSSFIIFGSIGYYCSGLISQPVRILTWIFLILATFCVQYFAPSARILDAFGFRIYCNLSLFTIGCGILIGLIRREIRFHSSNISMRS